jgi:hypothetical protein
MHNNKITMTELAARLGWTKGYCSMILNGLRTPSEARSKMEAALEELIKERKTKA